MKGKASKACLLLFQSIRKALRVINKMAEKNRFIVEEACQFAVTMTRSEKDWIGSMAVLYGEHALHQPSATHVWAGEHVQDGTAFSALNKLQNDLKAEPVYTYSPCKAAVWIWFAIDQTPKKCLQTTRA